MGKETFEVARIASPEDVADVLRALAAGLRRGEVSLDDIRRVAKRLIEADRLITTIVGKPVEARPKAAPG